MTRRIFAAAAVALALSACTELTTTGLPDQLIDESYHGQLINWTSGEQIVFAYKVFDIGGKVALCGARAESPGGGVHQRTFNDRAVASSYLRLGGEILVNSIGFFQRARWMRDELPQGTAACVRTDRPWRASYEGQPPAFEQSRTNFVVIG